MSMNAKRKSDTAGKLPQARSAAPLGERRGQRPGGRRLAQGPALLGRIESELRAWLEEREYASVEQLKGSASQRAVPDPDAYERANYLRTLRSHASRFPA